MSLAFGKYSFKDHWYLDQTGMAESIQNYQQAYVLVFEYINAFYNTLRIHSHCQYMLPNDYEKLYADFQKHNMRSGI